MANTKLQATASLFLNTKDAQKDAQRFVEDIRQKLSDIEKASDKMTVFKSMVDYISQVDRALSALATKNSDTFNKMFNGLDTSLRKQLEDIFGIDGTKLGQIDALREKLNTLTPKSSITEIRNFATEINNLFSSIGKDAPFENINEQFSGRVKTDYLKTLAVELANFATVWENVGARVSRGFGGGSGTGGGIISEPSIEVQEEINKLKQQQKEYLEIIDVFNGKKIKIQVDKKNDADTLRLLNAELKEARDELDRLEASGMRGSEQYYKAVAKYTKAASLFKNTYDYVVDNGSKKGIEYTFNSTALDSYEEADRYLNSYLQKNKLIVEQIKGLYSNLISDVNTKLEQLRAPSSTASDQDIKNKSSIYDELKNKLQEYYTLNEKLNNDDSLSDKQTDELYKKVDALDKYFLALDKTKSKQSEIKSLLGNLAFGDVDSQTALQNFCDLLGVQIPKAAETASSAVRSVVAGSSASATTNIVENVGSAAESSKNKVDALAESLRNAFVKATELELKGASTTETMNLFKTDGTISSAVGINQRVDTDTIVSQLIANLKDNMVMSLHNHANGNDMFSPQDVESFAKLYYGQGTKINGIITDGMIKTIDFTGISQELAIKIAQSYSDGIQNLVGKNSTLLKYTDGHVDYTDFAKGLKVTDPAIYRDIILATQSEINECLNQAFLQNGVQPTIKQFEHSQIPELSKQLIQIQENAQGTLTPVEKLKNLLSTMYPDKTFNWSNYTEIFDKFSSGAIDGSKAIDKILNFENVSAQVDQTKSKVQELYQFIESVNKSGNQVSGTTFGKTDGMNYFYDQKSIDIIKEKQSALSSYLGELTKLQMKEHQNNELTEQEIARKKELVNTIRDLSLSVRYKDGTNYTTSDFGDFNKSLEEQIAYLNQVLSLRKQIALGFHWTGNYGTFEDTFSGNKLSTLVTGSIASFDNVELFDQSMIGQLIREYQYLHEEMLKCMLVGQEVPADTMDRLKWFESLDASKLEQILPRLEELQTKINAIKKSDSMGDMLTFKYGQDEAYYDKKAKGLQELIKLQSEYENLGGIKDTDYSIDYLQKQSDLMLRLKDGINNVRTLKSELANLHPGVNFSGSSYAHTFNDLQEGAMSYSEALKRIQSDYQRNKDIEDANNVLNTVKALNQKTLSYEQLTNAVNAYIAANNIASRDGMYKGQMADAKNKIAERMSFAGLSDKDWASLASGGTSVEAFVKKLQDAQLQAQKTQEILSGFEQHINSIKGSMDWSSVETHYNTIIQGIKDGTFKTVDECIAKFNQLTASMHTPVSQGGLVADGTSGAVAQVSNEVAQLDALKAKLEEVRGAVEAKTKAFESESSTVSTSVNTELTALQTLLDKLVEISSQISIINDGFTKMGQSSSAVNNVGKTDLTVVPSGASQNTPAQSYALDATLSNTNNILNNILNAINNNSTLSDFASKIQSAIDELKNAAGEIKEAKQKQLTNRSVGAGRIANDYGKLSSIASSFASSNGTESAIKGMQVLADGITVRVEGAIKSADGAWKGFTADIDQFNNVVNHSINEQSSFAQSLNETAKKAQDVSTAVKDVSNNPVDSKFATALSNQQQAFDSYRNSLNNVDYITDELRNDLDSLGTSLKTVTNPKDLETWAAGFDSVKRSIAQAKSEFNTINTGTINLFEKELKNSYGRLDFSQKETLSKEYLDVIAALERQKELVKEGKAVEVNAIKEVVAALQEKINKQIESNRQAKKDNTIKEKNENFGSTAYINALAKHNALTNQVGDETFKDSTAVQTALAQYEQSYDKLIAKRNQLMNQDVITEEEKAEFKQITTECNKYASALEQLMKNSLSLRAKAGDGGIYTLGNDINPNDIIQMHGSMDELAASMSNGKAQLVGFNDAQRTATYEFQNAKGQVQQLTIEYDRGSNSLVGYISKTKNVTTATQEFFASLRHGYKNVARYLTTFGSVYRIFSFFRKGFQYVKEIDAALTELKKVTDETDASYNKFLQDMAKTGSRVGSTIKDLTTMAAEWARLNI